MPFTKITYSEPYRRATVHNRGCNFRCRGCAYKIKDPLPPEPPLSLAGLREALSGLALERVHFMGGEPTTNPELPAALALCRRELSLRTFLGHTNGSRIPLEDLDGANVSFKAFSPGKHLYYTGQPAEPVYSHFRQAHEAGLEMRASCVYIPGFVDLDEVEQIARFVADCSPEIPFHIMGYIPIPGTPWPRPTDQQMTEVVLLAREHLQQVGFSHLTVDEARDLTHRDDRFRVVRVR